MDLNVCRFFPGVRACACVILLMLGAILASPAWSQAIVVAPAGLPNGTQGAGYNQTILANDSDVDDGDPNSADADDIYTYAVTAGSLPPGLTLGGGPPTAAGVQLSGTPTTAGPYSFTITATDGGGVNNGSTSYSLTINPAPLVINPPSLPAATQGTPYSQTIVASGGTAPYSYIVLSGVLPPGLALNSGTGVISGTPTTGGLYNFTIQATDATPNTGSRAYTLNVGTNSLTVNPASLPAGTQNVAYSRTVSASGGTGPYTFAVAAGSLPTGLTLNAGTGVISGTPTTGGPFTFTIQATDSIGDTGSRPYTVNIGTNVLTVNPASLPAGSNGAPYSQTVSASGGTGSYTFTITAGSLPAGLALNAATGVISGTPTSNGVSNFTIQALDSVGNTGSRPYTISIGTNLLTVNPATLPAGTRNVAYSQIVSASGGTAPYTFSVIAGTLPTGLSLNAATGAITGTPTVSGQFLFTVQATDINGNFGSRPYAVNIGANTLTINPATLPPAPQGTPYSQTIVATGGATPYTYTMIAGALPPGLTLNPNTGVISGTPTTIGTFSFTVQARDINGNVGIRAYTLGTARLNPALDPDVQGLVASQASAARRFGFAQLSNVMQHLEGVHDDFDPCAFNFAIGLSVRDPSQPEIFPGAQNDASPFAPGSPGAQAAQRSAAQCNKNSWWDVNVAIWTGGSIEFGSNNPSAASSTSRFSTAGVTSGVDVRVLDNLIVGGAIGYGSDRTDIGTASTRSDGRNFSGLAYASYRPFPSWFVDATAGYGYLDFENRRSVAIDGSTVYGSRSGSTWMGSLAISTEFRQTVWKIAPYIRADFVSANLQSYAEQGLTNQALTFGAVGFSSSSAALGVRGFYDIPMGWGVLSPNARLEYRHALDGGYSQSMFYTDLGPGISYVIDQAAAAKDLLTVALGLRARGTEGVAFDVELGSTAAPGSVTAAQNRTLRASARVAF